MHVDAIEPLNDNSKGDVCGRPQNADSWHGHIALHKCNFSCEHCGYIYVGDAEDHGIRAGYRLTWDHVTTAIRDCAGLRNSYWNMNCTGGEPTLWEEAGKGLVDILIASVKGGTLPAYSTNGSYFADCGKCREFFRRYLDSADTPLKTFVRMDQFHKNCDPVAGRAKSLDNLARAMESFSGEETSLLSVHVVIIVTKDPGSSLPEGMKRHYGFVGIAFGDFPMLNIGKAKRLQAQLPEFSGFPPMPRKEEDGPPGLFWSARTIISGIRGSAPIERRCRSRLCDPCQTV